MVSTERIWAGTFLQVIVVLEALSSFGRSVRNSNGWGGRFSYYCAFIIRTVHDGFVGFCVPASLLAVGIQLQSSSQAIEPLLATVVGTLWYGPDRVQEAMASMFQIRGRWELLSGALAPYHRSMEVGGETGASATYVSEKRQLSFWPPCMHRRFCVTQGAKMVSDVYLRTVGRAGACMALNGTFSENDSRDWLVKMVADQARFKHSPLDSIHVEEGASPRKEYGMGAIRMQNSVHEIKQDWTENEMRKLTIVYEGIRKNGVPYLREKRWI